MAPNRQYTEYRFRNGPVSTSRCPGLPARFTFTHVRQGGSWRPGDAQLGWIIENRVDEAYILSWPGQLETYVPLHDTGGYDRARAPLGSYDFRLDQIKGTASRYLKNQIEIGFTTPALHPNPNLDFTFVDFHLPTRELVDPGLHPHRIRPEPRPALALHGGSLRSRP